MNLAAKRSALLRNKNVMRLGCVLVAVGFLVSSVVTPRARAVAVVDDVAVGAMSCAAFLESIGLPLSATVTAGVPAAELVSGGITAVAGEYAAATGAAASGEAFLGTVAAGATVSTVGTIILTAAAVAALAGLAYWLYTEYALDTVVESVEIFSDSGIYLANGDPVVLVISGVRDFDSVISSGATVFDFGELYTLTNGTTFNVEYLDGGGYRFYVNGIFSEGVSGERYQYNGKYVFFRNSVGIPLGALYNQENTFSGTFNLSKIFSTASPGSLNVSITENYAIPKIQPSQQMEITIPSAAPGSTLAELVETVPQQVVDGTLSATYTIDTSPPSPPSISDGDMEDVDDLGLPSLGEALTKRFPFSIPWDIARGITLLAAPAKTPYFEVDFYAPISGLVGGWKGSTKLVLDFSEFEVLGRLSRWTSTIGFCLFLASATKRFIWTA